MSPTLIACGGQTADFCATNQNLPEVDNRLSVGIWTRRNKAPRSVRLCGREHGNMGVRRQGRQAHEGVRTGRGGTASKILNRIHLLAVTQFVGTKGGCG